jgi:HEAT repeat protein
MSGPESEVAQLPEDLPPVEPPSAGFIVQLFVVPGIIVVAIVAVWLLFGKLATAEHDWRSLVVELQNPNEHRRWRGALGLAQVLKADQERGESGQHLASNRELAQTLADVLVAELKSGNSSSDEEFNYQAFLARTLGLFDLPEVVAPALENAMDGDHDREVRKNAIGAVAVMTDRMATAGAGEPNQRLEQAVEAVSADSDPLIRQLGAYTLGLFPQENARDRLAVLLEDPDADTRINAAIALARQKDARGLGVFRDILERAATGAEPGSTDEYEQFVALKNCLTAIERLAPTLSEDDRQMLVPLVEPIANAYREPKIRVAAQTALQALQARAE